MSKREQVLAAALAIVVSLVVGVLAGRQSMEWHASDLESRCHEEAVRNGVGQWGHENAKYWGDFAWRPCTCREPKR